MKRRILTVAFAAISLGIMADDIPSLNVKASSGDKSIALSTIQSIKYEGSNMIVTLTDNSQQTFSVDEVTSITFSNITAAIQQVFGNGEAAEKCVVTDLNGRIMQGDNLPKGVYIITSGNTSRKVIIK